MDTRIVFMGSPEFSLPTLQTLSDHYLVAGVVTQPDRLAGRGRTLTPPPIKTLAESLGLPIIQPRRLRDSEVLQQLQAWKPDVVVVAAFGQILRQEVLDLPPFGCINVHASLLPRWRGAAPIQAVLLHGDDKTGVTIMKMDPGIDTGDILSQRAVPILSSDTAETLSKRLAQTGAQLLMDTLPDYLRGEIQPIPQPDEHASYAPMLKKEDGRLDFSQTADALERRVRAMQPWPSAFTFWQDQPLKIHKAHTASGQARPGEQLVVGNQPAIGTAKGLLVLDELQPAGKRSMPGDIFLRGARDWGSMDQG
jgi:methionyl-tRNA formyltransferase